MKILAMVLAGGNGTRLHPLTADHAKPALPFAGGYRIIDFVLANLVNSGISPIYVLAQYKPQSLMEHVRAAWTGIRGRGRAISVVLPRWDGAPGFYRGTAAAVHHNLHLLARHKPDLVAVFAADHVYRMDVRQMAHFHIEQGADVTIAAVRVPIAKASAFGIISAGLGGEILDFQEKPAHPEHIPGQPQLAYASMGNYLFSPGVLADLLDASVPAGASDFGHDIMSHLPGDCSAWAYDFARNMVPGVRFHEESAYWRDIGTPDALEAARRDVDGPFPRFRLTNEQWPIRGAPHSARGNPMFVAASRSRRVAVRGAHRAGGICASPEANTALPAEVRAGHETVL